MGWRQRAVPWTTRVTNGSEPIGKVDKQLIDSIVEARREDGQLDETDLTFAELRTIKQALLGVLTGIYHVRVKYPEDDGEDGASWSGDQAADALNG